jgi:hypothetical protein
MTSHGPGRRLIKFVMWNMNRIPVVMRADAAKNVPQPPVAPYISTQHMMTIRLNTCKTISTQYDENMQHAVRQYSQLLTTVQAVD